MTSDDDIEPIDTEDKPASVLDSKSGVLRNSTGKGSASTAGNTAEYNRPAYPPSVQAAVGGAVVLISQTPVDLDNRVVSLETDAGLASAIRVNTGYLFDQRREQFRFPVSKTFYATVTFGNGQARFEAEVDVSEGVGINVPGQTCEVKISSESVPPEDPVPPPPPRWEGAASTAYMPTSEPGQRTIRVWFPVFVAALPPPEPMPVNPDDPGELPVAFAIAGTLPHAVQPAVHYANDGGGSVNATLVGTGILAGDTIEAVGFATGGNCLTGFIYVSEERCIITIDTTAPSDLYRIRITRMGDSTFGTAMFRLHATERPENLVGSNVVSYTVGAAGLANWATMVGMDPAADERVEMVRITQSLALLTREEFAVALGLAPDAFRLR